MNKAETLPTIKVWSSFVISIGWFYYLTIFNREIHKVFILCSKLFFKKFCWKWVYWNFTKKKPLEKLASIKCTYYVCVIVRTIHSILEKPHKQSVLIPPLKRNFPVTLRLLQKKETTIRIIHSTLRKWKRFLPFAPL